MTLQALVLQGRPRSQQTGKKGLSVCLAARPHSAENLTFDNPLSAVYSKAHNIISVTYAARDDSKSTHDVTPHAR